MHFLDSARWRKPDHILNSDEKGSLINYAYDLTEDEKIRQQCQAREDFEYWERIKLGNFKREIAARDQEIAAKDQEIAARKQEIATMWDEIMELRERLTAVKK